MSEVCYQLELTDLAGHYMNVRLSFLPHDAEPLQLSMPAWIPGSYMVRDFARHVLDLCAFDSDGPLALLQQDKQSWQLAHRGKHVTVCYQLYAFDLSVRANYLSPEIAVINPAASCLAVSGLQAQPCLLQISRGQAPADWQLACPLPRADNGALTDFGHFRAGDYHQLIDSPILAGELKVRSFYVDNVPHHLVLAGDVYADSERIATDLQPLCEQQKLVFGELPADLTDYWFLTWVVDDGYGGLEHRNSTLLLCNRFDLPNPQQPTISSEAYQNFLALCSHEYFHTWWVKRARPQELLSYQLAAEQYTQQLWLYEGFTSYYDDLSLLRAGKLQLNDYLTLMAKTISRLQRAPANVRQSLADSSFNAWTRFYRQDENAVNAVVSYYAKGSLVAWCLDAHLQAKGLSLDGLMQLCWQQFGKTETGSSTGLFFELLAQYSQDAALAAQCRRWVDAPEELPLQSSLALIGIALSWRAPQHMQDLHGEASVTTMVDTGLHYEAKAEGLLITAVRNQTSAHQAGLSKGDMIIAVAGLKASESTWKEVLQRHPAGAQLELYYFRQQRLYHTRLQLTAAPATVAVLEAREDNTSWPFACAQLAPE